MRNSQSLKGSALAKVPNFLHYKTNSITHMSRPSQYHTVTFRILELTNSCQQRTFLYNLSKRRRPHTRVNDPRPGTNSYLPREHTYVLGPKYWHFDIIISGQVREGMSPIYKRDSPRGQKLAPGIYPDCTATHCMYYYRPCGGEHHTRAGSTRRSYKQRDDGPCSSAFCRVLGLRFSSCW